MNSIPLGIEMALGGNLRVCEGCGKPFTQFIGENVAKLCATCKDIAQGRPSVVIRRQLIEVIQGVKVVSLPLDEWEEYVAYPSEGDTPVWRQVFKGREFGAEWAGRIDIYTPWQGGVREGDVVRLRHMKALHKIRKVIEEGRHGDPIERVVPITSDEGKEAIEEHEYIVLEPIQALTSEAKYELHWVKAYSKTTLKGYGRQYRACLDGDPLWKKEVSGGVRSGRAHTTAWLAVVDQEHPVLQRFYEGGEVEVTRYPS